MEGIAENLKEFECSICSEFFDRATSLNCSHTFCEKCILRWLEANRDCPMCRTVVTHKTRSLALDNFITKVRPLWSSPETKRKAGNNRVVQPVGAALPVGNQVACRGLHAGTNQAIPLIDLTRTPVIVPVSRRRATAAPTASRARGAAAPTASRARGAAAPTASQARGAAAPPASQARAAAAPPASQARAAAALPASRTRAATAPTASQARAASTSSRRAVPSSVSQARAVAGPVAMTTSSATQPRVAGAPAVSQSRPASAQPAATQSRRATASLPSMQYRIEAPAANLQAAHRSTRVQGEYLNYCDFPYSVDYDKRGSYEEEEVGRK